MYRAIAVYESAAFTERFIRRVQDKLSAVTLKTFRSRNEISGNEECTVLVTSPNEIVGLAPRFPHLAWVHSTWAGVDALFQSKQKIVKPEWILTRSGGFFGQLIAEFVIGQIIAWERGFLKQYDSQKQKQWANEDEPQTFNRTLSDLTIGILGVGEIGKEVADKCKTFGMQVWGLVRQTSNIGSCPSVDVYKTTEQLEELLSSVDFVCSILPSTGATNGFLSGDVLRHCAEKRAVFMNVGRGNVIADRDILRALERKWIGGAILDVFEKEPLSTTSPLWGAPNVVISPHRAAESLPEKVADAFVANWHQMESGQRPQFAVDWDGGY